MPMSASCSFLPHGWFPLALRYCETPVLNGVNSATPMDASWRTTIRNHDGEGKIPSEEMYRTHFSPWLRNLYRDARQRAGSWQEQGSGEEYVVLCGDEDEDGDCAEGKEECLSFQVSERSMIYIFTIESGIYNSYLLSPASYHLVSSPFPGSGTQQL